MSVRQYIGARYVPRFSPINNGIWDNSYSYEALEIVKYGNDYYTSKKPVPTGVAITNTEYWVLTGNYNGAINALDTRLTSAENNIISLNNNLTNYQNTISDIWYGKILLVMDSYGGTYGNETGDTTNIPDLLKSMLGNRIDSLVLPGCGFYRGSSEGNFITHLQTFVNSKTAKQLSEYHHVITLSGRNEYLGDRETELNYISAFFAYARNNFPNAKMYMGYIGGGDDNEAHGTRAQQYIGYLSMKSASDLYQIEWLNGCGNPMHDYTLLYSDGVHPTANGKRELAFAIYQCLVSGYYSMSKQIREITLTAPAGINYSQGSAQYMSVQDNIVCYYPTTYMTIGLNETISTGDYSRYIGTLSNNAFALHPFSGVIQLPYDLYFLANDIYQRVIGNVQLRADGRLRLVVNANAAQRANNIDTIYAFGINNFTIPILNG